MKKTIITIFVTGLFITSCSDGKQKFIGKHTFQVPQYTVDFDTSKVVNMFGLEANPKVGYFDLYTSNFEFYKSGDQIEGQMKFVYPDNPRFGSHRKRIREHNLQFKNTHLVNDTLYFIADGGAPDGVFDGIAYFKNSTIVIGLNKRLFLDLYRPYGMNNYKMCFGDYVCFIADEPVNKAVYYKSQADSLKSYIKSNPKEANEYLSTIEYLARK